MNSRGKTINIALLDLNHMTLGVHTNTVSLGAGLIAYYLKNNIDCNFDIRIFKNPTKFLNILENWTVDILGITQYSWNSELNLHMAQLVKKKNSNCLVVAGGPNLYLSTEERLDYLRKYNFIDICVSYDGEIPFAAIVSRFVKGENKSDIKRNPSPGTYSLEPERGRLVESRDPAPRIDSLDIFGSMYSEGFFDELLDEGFHPFLQTHRGCPFRCAYCHTSNDYYSKMIFQSKEYFQRDMEYLAKRFQGRHNVILYLANTNFGLFDEDFEIAEVIREMQEKYDWPRNINVNSGKNPDKLLKLLSILKYKFNPAIALQSLTPKVLETIGRKNLAFKDFVSFQRNIIETTGKNTATELILSLPEETKKSFLDTVSRVLDSGVQNIVVYTLMSLRGTPIASFETAQRYKHIIRYRIVPRCFSDIRGIRVFEIEEVVVGTKFMPVEDYDDLRGLALIIAVFASSPELFPVRKFLMERNINIAGWIFDIHRDILGFPSLHFVYKSFMRETKEELFSSKEGLVEFFDNQKNYNLLIQGKLGDNLLRKYKTIMLSVHFKDCLSLALLRLKQIATKHLESGMTESIDDLETYLKTRDMGSIFRGNYDHESSRYITLGYDIPTWLAVGGKKNLENYKGSFSYSVTVTDYMRKRLEDFREINRDSELSLQVIYRDGHTKDFWPLWVVDTSKKSLK